MKPTEEKIIKAEAIHFFLISMFNNADKLSKKDRTFFVTKDLITNFLKNIQYSPIIKSEIVSIGGSLDVLNLKVGDVAKINNLTMHIIKGENELYGAANFDIEKFEELAKKLRDGLIDED